MSNKKIYKIGIVILGNSSYIDINQNIQGLLPAIWKYIKIKLESKYIFKEILIKNITPTKKKNKTKLLKKIKLGYKSFTFPVNKSKKKFYNDINIILKEFYISNNKKSEFTLLCSTSNKNNFLLKSGC